MAKPASSPPGGVRALIVEDDRAWQQILSELLRDAGLTVDVADSQAAALATMRAASHRLAVIDLSLGGADHHNQDGLRVLQDLQRHDPACVAVMLTGFATVEIAVSVMKDYGAHTCLRKEVFRRAQFRELVRSVLAEPAPQGVSPSGVSNAVVPTEHAGPQAPSQKAARVLVVEDDPGWQDIFAELLIDAGYDVRLCRSYGEALGYLMRGQLDLAIVDLALANSLAPMDNVDGLRFLAACHEAAVPAIVVSGVASPAHAEQIYEQYQAFAFFEKQAFARQAFTQTVAAALTEKQASAYLQVLTEREREVMDLLAQGMTNKQIAETLVISPNTVKRHLKAIFTKLEVNTRAAAVAKVISEGG